MSTVPVLGVTPAKGFSTQLSAADVLVGEVPLSQLVPIVNPGDTPPGIPQDLTSGVTDLQMNRQIDGASYAVLQLQDASRSILNSALFDFGDTMTFDGLNFALVAFAKQADQLQITFEAALAYDLRKQSGPLAWKSATDLVGFVAHLLTAVPGAKLIAEPGPVSFDTGSGFTASTTVSQSVTISRGTTSTPNEDSWTAINRLANSAGYRAYECEGVLYLGSDAWLMSEFGSAGTLTEFTPAILNMDGTYDIGMPLGQVTVTAMSDLWPWKPGDAVTLARMGPLGRNPWLVFSMARNLYNPQGTMTLQAPMSAEAVRLGTPTLQYL